jgi:large subunit ribosomal protein L17
MRHQLKKYNLNSRKSDSRLVLRNLATSLVMFDKIVTTKTRAMALKSTIDRLINVAIKNDTVTAIRRLNSYFLDEKASRKVMEVLKTKYEDRTSGFTRITKEGIRLGDGALKYRIEFI